MIDDNYPDDSYVGRTQSPKIEHVFQDEIVKAFRDLFESRGIYQNITLKSDLFKEFVDENYSHEELISEFSKRPLFPNSRGDGDDVNLSGLRRSGSDRLGTPHDEMSISFYLPNIHSYCDRCKKETTFLSMSCSGHPLLGSPYPIISELTEQVYQIFYRCGNCRNQHLDFFVLRRGLKVQLIGRSLPYRPKLADEWPKQIREIVQDANAAASENDISAAYYHLRTAIEFLVKSELGINLVQRIDGAELCEQYNKTLDQRLKEGFPSIGVIYSTLSAGLHSRKVSKEEYDKQFNDILNHLRAKALFNQYSV